MTNERARTELEQLYMSLSEEKKKALDVAFKAMEQADNIPEMYYPQVDGITPTVVAQADGEYISRNNAITSICQWGTTLERTGIYTITVAEMKQTTTDMLCELPSVAIPSAEPKTGHWVAQDIHNCHTDFKCSECGYIHNFMHLYGEPIADYTYCPNCGAKMVEPQERSEEE